jgi:hypothetical protein
LLGPVRLRRHDEDTSASRYVAKLLDLPEGMEVATIVAVGYPAEEKSSHPADSLPYAKISYERYGRKPPFGDGP